IAASPRHQTIRLTRDFCAPAKTSAKGDAVQRARVSHGEHVPIVVHSKSAATTVDLQAPGLIDDIWRMVELAQQFAESAIGVVKHCLVNRPSGDAARPPA